MGALNGLLVGFAVICLGFLGLYLLLSNGKQSVGGEPLGALSTFCICVGVLWLRYVAKLGYGHFLQTNYMGICFFYYYLLVDRSPIVLH